MSLRLAAVLFTVTLSAQSPTLWDPAALSALELPTAQPGPKPISAEAYYKLPVRDVWKTYPVYHPEKAPPDYIEWLRTQEPERIPNPDGETLFHAPTIIGSFAARPPSDPPFIHDKNWFDRINPPLNREGAITGLVYVLRTKGKVEIGAYSCASCHTRVLPNGAVIKGGPGNFPVDAALAEDLLASTGNPALRDANKDLLRRLFQIPGDFSLAAAAKLFAGRPAGVVTPFRSTPAHPVQVPDITGLANRRYLEHTGLYQISRPEDLARYVARKQHVYAPDSRASDEQLQSLAAYVAGLKTPTSPIKPDKTTRLGEKIFEREGCAQCHTAATKLTPVQGFAVPPEHKAKYDIIPTVVGTNPALALETARATGYYKVPSLKGLWYRSLLEHSGAGTSLEDWFSPARLQYLKGHEYGFQLSATDRFALIAYLRTL